MITVVIFILGHLIASVWWASKITITLEFIKKEIKENMLDIKKMEETYARKKDIDDLWRKIEKMEETNA